MRISASASSISLCFSSSRLSDSSRAAVRADSSFCLSSAEDWTEVIASSLSANAFWDDSSSRRFSSSSFWRVTSVFCFPASSSCKIRSSDCFSSNSSAWETVEALTSSSSLILSSNSVFWVSTVAFRFSISVRCRSNSALASRIWYSFSSSSISLASISPCFSLRVRCFSSNSSFCMRIFSFNSLKSDFCVLKEELCTERRERSRCSSFFKLFSAFLSSSKADSRAESIFLISISSFCFSVMKEKS